MIELGVIARDKITGFGGIVTGRAEYLTGCVQYMVTPPVKKDGSYAESGWLDEDRLEVICNNKFVLTPDKAGKPNDGPMEPPPAK